MLLGEAEEGQAFDEKESPAFIEHFHTWAQPLCKAEMDARSTF